MKKMEPLLVICLVGFFFAIIVLNIGYEGGAQRANAIAELFLLQDYLRQPPEANAYFFYLLKWRGMGYLLGAALGISVLGLPFSMLWMGMLGFTVGSILTSALLVRGLGGMLLGICMLLPQGLIYLPVSFYFFHDIFRMSFGCWKNKRYRLEEYRAYGLRIFFYTLLLLVGIGMETWVNPILLRFLMDRINYL